MVHEVGIKTGCFYLVLRQVPGKLVDQGPHHFQVAQFFRANIGKQALQFRIGHGVPLAQVPQGRAQFSVRSSVLGDNQRRQFGIGVLDADRILQFLLIDEHQRFPPKSQGQGSFSQA